MAGRIPGADLVEALAVFSALVAAAGFEAGALNQSVWDARVASGEADPAKVREVVRTPTYSDYHWAVRPDVDRRLGDGTTQPVTDARLGLDPADPADAEVLTLFKAERFVPLGPDEHDQVEKVAREAGLIR